MSDNHVGLEIVNWLQRSYGGKKIGRAFGMKNQWLVASYMKSPTILVLGFAQGPKQARIMQQGGNQFEISIEEIQSLEDFKKQFKKILNSYV